MLSLRLCGQLIRTFPIGFRACQARFNQTFVLDIKKRGYVGPFVYLQPKRTYNKRDSNNNYKSQINDKYQKRSNNFHFNILQVQLELLKIDLKCMTVDYVHLLDAINYFDRISENIDDSISIFLLHCCGELLPDVNLKIRQELLHRLWNSLEKNNHPLSHDHYHTFLNVCAQNTENIDVKKFLELMKIKPTKDTFLSLLNVTASTGDLDGANFLISKIKELEYTLDTEVLNALIKLYSTRNDMESAQKIINNAIELGITLSDEIYGNLVCGYARQGDIDRVISLLNEHELSSKHLIQILRNLSLANQGENMENIFKYISVNEKNVNPFLINVIVELTHLNKIDDSLLIIDFFSSKQIQSDLLLNIIKHFLQTLAKNPTSIRKIFNIRKIFYEKYSFSVVNLALLKGALVSNNIDLSFFMLEERFQRLFPIRPHYYWPIFIQISKEEGEPGVFRSVDHMVKMGVEPDFSTLCYYVIPNISTLDPIGTFRKLTNHGLKANIVTTPLIIYYIENGYIDRALEICKKLLGLVDFDELLPSLVKTYGMCRNDIHSILQILLLSDKKKDYFGKFMLKVLNSKVFEKIISFQQLVKIYEQHKITISSFSAISIEDYAFRANLEQIAVVLRNSNIINDDDKSPVTNAERISGIIHPKHMNENQLKCHVIELQSKRLNYRGALKKLFMAHCKNNNLKGAEIIKKELDKNSIHLTPGIKSSLLNVYAEHNPLDAYSIIVDLQQNYPSWSIDPPKILKTATALVKIKEVEKAFRIIKETRIISHQSPRNCWKLLNALACLGNSHSVENMMNLLIKKGFCEIENKILGPNIRVHLLKNDLPAAVKAFTNMAKKFHKTPLRGELITILIKAEQNPLSESIENSKLMLDEVLDFSTGIHGRQTIEIDLLRAYAECNMLVPLKEILQKLQPDQVDFRKIVAGIKDDVKQLILMRVFEAARGINTIDRKQICDLLLTSYSNTSNIRDARGLWQQIKNEGIMTPSTESKFSMLSNVHKESILDHSKKIS